MIWREIHEEKELFSVDEVIREASVAEKVSLLSGHDFWHTQPLPRFNVPSIRFSDGPNGVRGTKFFNGVSAACLPCGTGLASTWDRELIYQAGVLIGEECKAKGVHCWLGPTVGIQRSPLGGRGFESMFEDPYATGKMAAAYINGVKSTGVIPTLKHWFANDQEHERVAVNAIVTERAMREIHMLPFQIALKDSNPGAIMACYNKVNGTHVSENRETLEGVLRDDWGWNGLIMSDWFGTYSTAESINAGLDLEMPGPTRLRGPLADLAFSTRKITRKTIDERARNVLVFVSKACKIQVSPFEGARDFPEDRLLNRELAASSVVLLRNDSKTLPLSHHLRSIALIGPNMKKTAFCGGGSAALQPYYTVSPFEGIVSKLAPETKVTFETGAVAYGFLPVISSNTATTPEGQKGLRMRFYRSKEDMQARRFVEELIVPESSWQLMGYSHPELEKLFYADIETDIVVESSGAYEVGSAVYGSMKLFVDNDILIDNATKQVGGNFWFGKGTREEKKMIALDEGRKYRFRAEFGSAPTSTLVKPGVVNFGGGAGRFGLAEVLDENVSITKAVEAAKCADVVVLCAGLSSDWECEGVDRKDMRLPGNLDKMIKAVVTARPDTVLVTQSGMPFDMTEFIDGVSTHLHMWYGGNETGNGLADVLFGDNNPSAKLPVTFPRCIEDTPTFLNFGSERGRVVYGEGIYVGYRYYEKVNREVLYEFGHGLSYTEFAYQNLQISETSVKCHITNTGSVPGAEVVQVYIAASPETSSIARPKKELKGFEKVFLQPKEQKAVEVQLDRFAVAFWDEVLRAWVCEQGKYQVLVGSSSSDIRLLGELSITETTSWTGL